MLTTLLAFAANQVTVAQDRPIDAYALIGKFCTEQAETGRLDACTALVKTAVTLQTDTPPQAPQPADHSVPTAPSATAVQTPTMQRGVDLTLSAGQASVTGTVDALLGNHVFSAALDMVAGQHAEMPVVGYQLELPKLGEFQSRFGASFTRSGPAVDLSAELPRQLGDLTVQATPTGADLAWRL